MSLAHIEIHTGVDGTPFSVTIDGKPFTTGIRGLTIRDYVGEIPIVTFEVLAGKIDIVMDGQCVFDLVDFERIVREHKALRDLAAGGKETP